MRAEPLERRDDLVDAAAFLRRVIDQPVNRERHRIVGIRRDPVCAERRALGLRLRLCRHHDARRIADCRAARRHRLHDDRVRTDLRARPDGETAEHLRARTDDHAGFERRVALGAARERRAAQRHALIDRAVIADDRRLADHDTHAVIDEHAPADRRTGVDFDACQEPAGLRRETREPVALHAPACVRETMQHERMQPRITGQHFPCTASGGIPLANRCNVFAQSREHDVVWEKAGAHRRQWPAVIAPGNLLMTFGDCRASRARPHEPARSPRRRRGYSGRTLAAGAFAGGSTRWSDRPRRFPRTA